MARASLAECSAYKLTEIARMFESVDPELAHACDQLARQAQKMADDITAAEDLATAQSERESAEWELTTGREFDAAVSNMPTEQLQRMMGA